jgi:hypothetical protein
MTGPDEDFKRRDPPMMGFRAAAARLECGGSGGLVTDNACV